MDTTHQLKIKTFINGLVTEEVETVAVECPLTLFVNDVEYATVLCSLSNIKALIFGLLKNDYLIQNKEDVLSIIIDEAKGLVYVELELIISEHQIFKKRYITAGCASSAMYYETLDAVKLRTTPLKPYLDISMTDIINRVLMINKSTEIDCLKIGLQQAVLSSSKKEFTVETDINCEHAVDKVIGQMILDGISSDDTCLVVSCKITSKTVLKCAKQGISVIVSLSIPTSLAIKMAESLNIILIGIGRCEKGNVYTGFDHVKV